MSTYPSSVKSFATRSGGQTIAAAHINDLQDEINAIEAALLSTGLAHHLFPDATTRTLGTSSKPWGTTFVSALAYIGDTTNAFMTSGLTINQAGADNEILSLKSSDITHSMTNIAEADTFAVCEKASATSGGLLFTGYSAGVTGLLLRGAGSVNNSTRTTAATAPVQLRAAAASGGTVTGYSADQNIVVFTNNGTATHIFDSDGDSFQDVGTAWTNFDSHDDVLVLNALAASVSRDGDPYKNAIRQQFGDALDALIPRQAMEQMKLVTFNEDGHHFVNMSKLTMLHTGAIRQLARSLDRMTQALVSSGVVSQAQLEAA